MAQPPFDHFLSLSRPDVTLGEIHPVDTTTLAAHDFDVDNRTGFMPPQPPLKGLGSQWEAWETLLEDARSSNLKLGDQLDLTTEDRLRSERWRERVRKLSVLSIHELKSSEVHLRRAHLVLGWIMHYYIHSLPTDAPIVIPRPIALPLLRVSAQLRLPPVLTYSDTVLYNWDLITPSQEPTPDLQNLRSQTLFTGTIDEQEFYLASARIEIRGVEALELMRATMDEVFVGDETAKRRITLYLSQLAVVIKDLEQLLMDVRKLCQPEVFFRQIRPWFRGADSSADKRPWIFEGLEEDPELKQPTELSGPSAGQSSLVHALDIFLGVSAHSHAQALTGSSDNAKKPAFLDRMRRYMPRHHRGFLTHLANNPRPLRALVASSEDPELAAAFNTAVISLKEFRDAHMKIVALYIIGPANRVAKEGQMKRDVDSAVSDHTVLKGTGGTELVKFLKEVRSRTTDSIVTLPQRGENIK